MQRSNVNKNYRNSAVFCRKKGVCLSYFCHHFVTNSEVKISGSDARKASQKRHLIYVDAVIKIFYLFSEIFTFFIPFQKNYSVFLLLLILLLTEKIRKIRITKCNQVRSYFHKKRPLFSPTFTILLHELIFIMQKIRHHKMPDFRSFSVIFTTCESRI